MSIATDRNSAKPPRLYYGWVIVAMGFVTLGAAFGVWYSFSVFIIAIIKEFGWSRGAASSIFSVFIFSHALMNVVTGRLQDRYGPRIVIPMGAVILALALALTSLSRNLWHFAVAYGVFAGAGVSLLGFASHAAFIPKWFERKRGLAVGITMSGIGFGMLIVIPLVETAIRLVGWRMAYLYLALMIVVVVAPLNALLARRSPQSMGLIPDGDGAPGSVAPKAHHLRLEVVDPLWAQQSWTLKTALQTVRFWYLSLAFFFMAFSYQGILLHAVSAMVDEGLNRETAAYFFGLLGLAGSAGKIILGYLSDVYGRERAMTLGAALAISGIFCLLQVSQAPALLPLFFALLFGLGYGAAAPLLPSVCADIFLSDSFGVIFAVIAIGGGAGGALGSYMAGLLFDLSGTYATPFSIYMGCLAVSCVLIWKAAPRKVRRMVRAPSLC